MATFATKIKFLCLSNFKYSRPIFFYRQYGQERFRVPDNIDKTKSGPPSNVYTKHDVDTSITYMESKAYQTTYGDSQVWEPYRRNHKGSIPPQKTRKMCIRAGLITTGNPCPICRDEYLVVHEKNLKLLKQFISPDTGEILPYLKTQVCRKQHKELILAVMKAQDKGYIEAPIPFREYDYSQYYDESIS